MSTIRAASLGLALLLNACSSSTPPPAKPAEPARPAAPRGPTKTDFEDIAKKLMARCVSGGWIERWRSEHEDVDVAKPKIYLEGFDDQTGHNLDPTYLMSVLEKRMRLSGVYDLVPDAKAADFVAHGKLLRLAERTGGSRVSVYTAILNLQPASGSAAASCEATVQGEL
ncbi:MAG: hypothetical protein HY791_27165 [Deltaproteobacteria bacterium]|nr:hypothetical protein [Deltaproteobacteria bacterium]